VAAKSREVARHQRDFQITFSLLHLFTLKNE